MYEVDKSIPVEQPLSPLRGMTEFLRSLNVGDIFLCDPDIRGRILRIARQGGIRVSTRKINSFSMLVWRIE